MNLFVYTTSPLDSGFENLKTVEETRRFIELEGDTLGYSVEDFDYNWEVAKAAAKKQGLFGVYRHDPHVFEVTIEDRLDYAFIIKQDENGITYFISPCELSDLEEIFDCEISDTKYFTEIRSIDGNYM